MQTRFNNTKKDRFPLDVISLFCMNNISMKRFSLKQWGALLLALMLLTQSGPMMMSAGHHLLEHEGKHHEAQHADLTCNIICTASHFIESAHPVLDQPVSLLFATLVLFFPIAISRFTDLSFYARPPPA
jgi:hypothetical protein